MQAGDRQKLCEDGYVVLQQVIPPEMLAELQAAHDQLVESQAKLTGLWPSIDVGRTVIDAGNANGVRGRSG